jgi:type I restriction enzyme S subunit
MIELPNGWSQKELGEIADTQLGKMLNKSKQNDSRKVPYLRTDNVHWGRIDLNLVKEMEITPEERVKFIAQPGDLLICEGGASGRTAIWNLDYEIGIQNHLHRVRTRGEVSNKYLMYYMEWLVKNGLINHLIKGVTISHLSQSSLRSIGICYPGINEQHEIVEILEDHLSRLDAALADLQKARNMCSSLLAASLKSIVESVPHVYRPLSDVVDKIEAGKSFNCLGRPAEKQEWGVIKVSAMTWGEFLPTENKAAPLSYSPPLHHKINLGDILISRANTQKYVGAAVRVKSEPGKLLLSDKSLRIVPKRDYDASWLVAVLASPVTREAISKLATGNEDSMRNISQKNLLRVQVPVPLEQKNQLQVVESLSLVETGIASNLQIIEENLTRMNQFRRSILNKAFSGQLLKEVVGV